MDPAVVPYLGRQRRPSSAPCVRLQPRQFHANAGDAQAGGAVVTDQPAREADQDRCQDRQPWPLRHFPNGRGRSVAADVPGNPVADRPAAGTARTSMRSAGAQMRETTAEVRLQSRPSARESPVSSSIWMIWSSSRSFIWRIEDALLTFLAFVEWRRLPTAARPSSSGVFRLIGP